MNKPDYINPIDWKLLTNKYDEKFITKKLSQNYPIQYLIGNVNFYGYEINVDKRVFIPRPETEFLVDKTLKIIKKLQIKGKICDICSGSGCISIALSKELNQKITAIEINPKSIKLAIENCKKNKASIDFIKKDLFKIEELEYDIIVSNPPYVGIDENVDIQTKYEPQIALFSKSSDSTIFYKHIIDIASLNTKLIAFEIGLNQAKIITAYAKTKFPNHKIVVEKDLADKERYIFIINE